MGITVSVVKPYCLTVLTINLNFKSREINAYFLCIFNMKNIKSCIFGPKVMMFTWNNPLKDSITKNNLRKIYSFFNKSCDYN